MKTSEVPSWQDHSQLILKSAQFRYWKTAVSLKSNGHLNEDENPGVIEQFFKISSSFSKKNPVKNWVVVLHGPTRTKSFWKKREIKGPLRRMQVLGCGLKESGFKIFLIFSSWFRHGSIMGDLSRWNNRWIGLTRNWI